MQCMRPHNNDNRMAFNLMFFFIRSAITLIELKEKTTENKSGNTKRINLRRDGIKKTSPIRFYTIFNIHTSFSHLVRMCVPFSVDV